MRNQKIHFANCSRSPDFDPTLLLKQKGGWTPSEWAKGEILERNSTE